MTTSKLGTDVQTGQIIELPKSSRLQGLYIIGIQGTGKSGLLENLIMQDIKQTTGVCVLDPHGELINNVLARLPGKTEEEKVILLDITDYTRPFGLNLFTCSDPTNTLAVQEVVDQVMHVFEKLYDVSRQTPRMAQFLRNCTHTLVANPGYTMADIPLLLQDEQCRKSLVAHVTDPQVRLFWKTYNALKPSEQFDRAESTINKMDELLQPLPRNIVGQAGTTIDLQEVMNKGLILLVKLSAKIESVSSLIGSLMIAIILNAAYNRPAQRRQFHVYADEFQRFATEDFATLLEEARKFGIATTIAHQNRGQLNSANAKLETDLKDRSRSVGNMVVFKINSKDAEDLAGEFKIAPPAADTRREANLTYKQNVLEHLVQQGHESPTVQEFVMRYVQPLRKAVTQEIDKSPMGLRASRIHYTKHPVVEFPEGETYAYDPDEVKEGLRLLNNMLFQEMSGRSDASLHVEYEKPNPIVKALSHVLGFPHYYEGYYESGGDADYRNVMSSEYADVQNARLRFYGLNKKLKGKLSQQEKDDLEEQRYQAVRVLDYNGMHLVYFQLMKQLSHGYQVGNTSELYADELFTFGYKGSYTEEEISRGKVVKDIFFREDKRYHDFYFLLEDVVWELKIRPVMTESGSYEEKPLAPRTYADVQNEIANSLVALPNFTARVKIASTNGTLEQLIKTIQPEKGIYGKLLQERIARIQVSNMQDGILRNRADVEAEILQRQTRCSGGSSSTHLQPQQPLTQTHTRQVAVQGDCPNCGFSNNRPGANFCMQCGTKLA